VVVAVNAQLNALPALVEPFDALVEFVDLLTHAGHHLEQTPQNALHPNQRGSDLLHLDLEQGQAFFNHRHLEPPHNTVVLTIRKEPRGTSRISTSIGEISFRFSLFVLRSSLSQLRSSAIMVFRSRM
jgi:hypothetical protein